MTHVYAYVKEGFQPEQIKDLIAGIKKAVSESFQLDEKASTVVVKEVSGNCSSENLGVFALVYTAKGKGFDQKKLFARRMDEICKNLLGDVSVKMVMKEQAADMVGLNGTLRCHNGAAMSDFEMC